MGVKWKKSKSFLDKVNDLFKTKQDKFASAYLDYRIPKFNIFGDFNNKIKLNIFKPFKTKHDISLNKLTSLGRFDLQSFIEFIVIQAATGSDMSILMENPEWTKETPITNAELKSIFDQTFQVYINIHSNLSDLPDIDLFYSSNINYEDQDWPVIFESFTKIKGFALLIGFPINAEFNEAMNNFLNEHLDEISFQINDTDDLSQESEIFQLYTKKSMLSETEINKTYSTINQNTKVDDSFNRDITSIEIVLIAEGYSLDEAKILIKRLKVTLFEIHPNYMELINLVHFYFSFDEFSFIERIKKLSKYSNVIDIVFPYE